MTNQANLLESITQIIKSTSTDLPDDVQNVILQALAKEEKETTAEYAMKIIKANIELAKKKSQPLCQDTGTILFFVSHPPEWHQGFFRQTVEQAVRETTQKGYLRQNSVDVISGKNECMNVGPGHPDIHFQEYPDGRDGEIEVRLMLKGGGCENVGAQYSLPHTDPEANRDWDGVRKVILDSVVKAQGKGCGPGVLGVCVGGDRGSGYIASKKQLLRPLDDTNPLTSLAKLEQDIVTTSNKLGIGPMGFGGRTTLLGCKIGTLNRLPASYFVSISYMCWAYRRRGFVLSPDYKISRWIY